MSRISRAERAETIALDETAAEMAAHIVDLQDEVALLTHKVITCGVAASHSDAGLSRRGAYGDIWDSPQAEDVRALRARAVAAEAALEEARRERDEVKADVLKMAEVAARGFREQRDEALASRAALAERVRELEGGVRRAETLIDIIDGKRARRAQEILRALLAAPPSPAPRMPPGAEVSLDFTCSFCKRPLHGNDPCDPAPSATPAEKE